VPASLFRVSGALETTILQNSLFFSLLAGSPTSIIKHLADYWRQVATGFGDTRAGSLRMLVRMLFWENMEDSPVIFSGDV
jgi:hypothetical protein